MAWFYLTLNAMILLAAGLVGWRSRRFGSGALVGLFLIAGALMGLRTFLHLRPEYEQCLLDLSYDYVYFSAWEAPVALFMTFALACRLETRWVRRFTLASLVFLAPIFLWNSLVPCLQPHYAMAARFDGDNVCRQSTDYSCGPAAAVTVLKRLGKHISEGEMARLCLLRPDQGVTVLELCRGMNVALRGDPVRATIKRLEAKELDTEAAPFLAEIRRPPSSEHCVVVLEVDRDVLVLADPAYGKRVCTRDEFLRQWTGLAITLTPTVQTARSPFLADAGRP